MNIRIKESREPLEQSQDDSGAAKRTNAQNREAAPPTYGGFQYRWYYDDYQKSLENKRRRANNAGLRVFAITVTAVFFVCFMSLACVILVNYFTTGSKSAVVGYDSGSALDGSETESASASSDASSAKTAAGAVSVKEYSAENAQPLTIPEIAEKVKPSVVGITVEGTDGTTVATGIILTEDGYIVTNNHVVSEGGTFKVYTQDGTEYDGVLIGMDSLTDIAVLKIESVESFPAAELGDSNSLVDGEEVVAIGTPAGIQYAGTVTNGIISAINRDVPIPDETGKIVKTMTVIQTNANINPGNSGGPLINCCGQVIGINTMKLSNGYDGIGFAIPISGAVPIINELIANGTVTTRPDSSFAQGKPKIGITCRNIDDDTARIYRLPVGILVELIDPEADAYSAGLAIGDIIVQFNDTDIESIDDLSELLAECKAGEDVKIKIYRSGKYYDIEFTLDSFA